MISLLRSQLFKQTLLDIPLILSESNLAMLNAPCLMIVPAIHLHGQCGVSQLASDCQQAYLLISPIIAALWLMFDPYHFIILYWRWLHPFTSSRNIQCYPMRSPFFLVKSQLFQRFLRLVSIYIYILIPAIYGNIDYHCWYCIWCSLYIPWIVSPLIPLKKQGYNLLSEMSHQVFMFIVLTTGVSW